MWATTAWPDGIVSRFGVGDTPSALAGGTVRFVTRPVPPHVAQEPLWRGEASVSLDFGQVGRWRLPRTSTVLVGRLTGAGISLRPEWAPRRLCRLEPVRDGWLHNDSRTRLRAESLWVTGGVFEPRAIVLLQSGRWCLSWDLDGDCRLDVSIRRPSAKASRLPFALDAVVGRALVEDMPATHFAATDLALSPLARYRLAVLFEHLILADDPPENLYAAYADRFHRRDDPRWEQARLQVKSTAVKTRDRLNRARPHNPLRDVADLGYYLVTVTETLREEDLTP